MGFLGPNGILGTSASSQAGRYGQVGVGKWVRGLLLRSRADRAACCCTTHTGKTKHAAEQGISSLPTLPSGDLGAEPTIISLSDSLPSASARLLFQIASHPGSAGLPLLWAYGVTHYPATQLGHYTYECKGEATYVSRPSRTQQLKNPKVELRIREGSLERRYAE